MRACNYDAPEKKHVHTGAASTKAKTQNRPQPGCRCIGLDWRPLLSRQMLSLDSLTECSKPSWSVPEEHFEYEDVDVKESDRTYYYAGMRITAFP